MNVSDTRPVRDRADLEAVLGAGFDRIEAVAPEFPYRLVGTAAACMQGVELSVGDVDILVRRRRDVDAVAAALADRPCVTCPVWIEESRQYFACYSVDGVGFSVSTVEVGCEADGWEAIGPGPWLHYVSVVCGRRSIYCVRPELRLVSELVRDRPSRYWPLLDHLAAHGADLDLLQRSFEVREVPEALGRLALTFLSETDG